MEVLRYWARHDIPGLHVDFLATSGKQGIFDAEAQSLGARIFYLPYQKKRLGSFAREFRTILREGNHAAIHDHQDYASGWHFLMGAAVLPPIRVTHVHNPSYQIRNNYGRTFARRLTAATGKRLVRRFATHITGTSRQVIGEYGFDAAEFGAIPKAALYCGFDARRFAGSRAEARASVLSEFGWRPDARIILFAGRLDLSPELNHPRNHKNSGFAVDVAIECARRNPTIHAIFAGAPSGALDNLRARVGDAGLAGRIKFLGIRKDIARLMRGSDILLFPSRGEGLGMVAVEAQAASLPVLASSTVPRECVVVPEIIRFEDVAAGNGRWADKVLELIESDISCADANERVARSPFSVEQSAEALHRLYAMGRLS